MSLPPGFLDELRGRLSIAQVAGRKVSWDRRKSNQSKGDLWAPCPFHQEKTASFHVDDRKGFYYCFGCHAKGDAISFVRETENLGFLEAVELLAREAGMAMPARDPAAEKRADIRSALAEVMEEAVRWLRLQLRTGAGQAARDYLVRRGLGEAALERWEIGFAPDARTALFDALTAKGIATDLILEAGLCARPADGGAPYDRFRGRIAFPIRDLRGRAIALGGRAMDPAARAKYLNSPETPLFDKGRSLYNHAPARAAAGKQRLIVAEGYMDTIALVEAGFGATVAPLGTAVTEDQLYRVWQMHPEPIIALDGDAAGRRAAMRLVDLALPHLEAGRTLYFALLPEGQDPDDLIREGGAQAMQAALDAALPLVRMLWEREYDGGRGCETPEGKAGLKRRLEMAIGTIRDPGVRRYYARAIDDFLFQAFRQARSGRKVRTPSVTPEAKASMLAGGDERAIDALRERVVIAALVANPTAVSSFEYPLETFNFLHGDHQRLVLALLEHGQGDGSLQAELGAVGLADALTRVTRDPMIRVLPGCRIGAPDDLVRTTVAGELAWLEADRSARREIEESEEDIVGPATEALTWRLGQAARARAQAGRGEAEDRTEWDLAENGLRLSRAERETLDSLREAALHGPKGRSGG